MRGPAAQPQRLRFALTGKTCQGSTQTLDQSHLLHSACRGKTCELVKVLKPQVTYCGIKVDDRT